MCFANQDRPIVPWRPQGGESQPERCKVALRDGKHSCRRRCTCRTRSEQRTRLHRNDLKGKGNRPCTWTVPQFAILCKAGRYIEGSAGFRHSICRAERVSEAERQQLSTACCQATVGHCCVLPVVSILARRQRCTRECGSDGVRTSCASPIDLSRHGAVRTPCTFFNIPLQRALRSTSRAWGLARSRLRGQAVQLCAYMLKRSRSRVDDRTQRGPNPLICCRHGMWVSRMQHMQRT